MNSQQSPAESKQPYEAPVLTFVGSVTEITLGGAGTPTTDGGAASV